MAGNIKVAIVRQKRLDGKIGRRKKRGLIGNLRQRTLILLLQLVNFKRL